MRSRVLGFIAILLVAGLITWSVSSGTLPVPGLTPFYDTGEERESSGDQDEEGEVEPELIETILRSDSISFGYSNVTFLVIQTEEEWEALWDKAGGEPPTVDFESYTVLVALLGLSPSGGYAIEIMAASGGPDGVFVRVEATAPGPHCVVIAVITYPAHIVKIPKTDGPFDFDLELSTYRCDE